MSPQTDLDHSRHLLSQLGFEHIPPILPELVEQGVRDELTLTTFLDLVCQREQDFRQERRIRNALRLSGLPQGKTLVAPSEAWERGKHVAVYI